MDFLQQYGVEPYINAHDTITLYGASRMADETLEAMRQAGKAFVNLRQMQRTLGEKIAEMTHNEAAYITNCAAGGIQVCTAVCLANGDWHRFWHLPQSAAERNQILVMHSQHNCYDQSVRAAGGQLVLVGDADETLAEDYENSFNEHVAGVLYVPSSRYAAASLPLRQAAEIAHRHGVPVIVDAAAQLPPVENLWRFCKEGGDMVIFSGGKTLCGPQASGLVVGGRQYIDDCLRFGAPEHGICRSCKVSREEMLGLTVAIQRYMETDHEQHGREMSRRVDALLECMRRCGLESWREESGSVGQTYPRAFGRTKGHGSALRIAEVMKERRIFIGASAAEETIYFSPLNLTDDETDKVCRALTEVLEREAADTLQDSNDM